MSKWFGYELLATIPFWLGVATGFYYQSWWIFLGGLTITLIMGLFEQKIRRKFFKINS